MGAAAAAAAAPAVKEAEFPGCLQRRERIADAAKARERVPPPARVGS